MVSESSTPKNGPVDLCVCYPCAPFVIILFQHSLLIWLQVHDLEQLEFIVAETRGDSGDNDSSTLCENQFPTVDGRNPAIPTLAGMTPYR